MDRRSGVIRIVHAAISPSQYRSGKSPAQGGRGASGKNLTEKMVRFWLGFGRAAGCIHPAMI
jgi:hypothetical protein